LLHPSTCCSKGTIWEPTGKKCPAKSIIFSYATHLLFL
jgi:hypothetical protein